MSRNCLLASLLAFGAIAAQAQPPSQPARQPAAQADKKTAAAAPPDPQLEEGVRVFKQNCYRCHMAPSGFSSRISGTVVMHMRVRASLSQADAEKLLHFLNP